LVDDPLSYSNIIAWERQMMKKLKAFLFDESGQTSTEYILLVAVVALIVFKFKGIAVQRLEQLTGKIFDGGDKLANEIMEQ
jgi:pilus assembly protein Flp/PilA